LTIYCSNLPNDQDMIRALGSVAVPLPIATGDCCFSGVGDNGQPICITVERKKLGDLCQCIQDGRYTHQLQIAKANGADVFCLIVEVGDIRSNPDDGLLERSVWGINPRTLKRSQVWEPVKPTMTYSRFDQYLTELDYLAGIIVKRSRDVRETAVIIKALQTNFQTPPNQHGSLKQIFKSPSPAVQLVKPSLVRRVAAELPSIGWEWSGVIDQRFGSVQEMVGAGVGDWASLCISNNGKSRRLGKQTAEKIVKALR